MQRDNETLIEKYSSLEEESENRQREQQHLISTLRMKLDSKNDEFQAFQLEWQRRERDSEVTKQKLAEQIAELKSSQQATTLSDNISRELEVLRRCLHEEYQQREKLTREINEMRLTQKQSQGLFEANCQLNEEKRTLSLQLQQLEDIGKTCLQLENELMQLKREKTEWTSFLQSTDLTDSRAPYVLATTLARERQEHLLLLEKYSEIQADKRRKERELDDLQRKVNVIFTT